MNKFYIYEYSPEKFAIFKVLHDDKGYIYGEYLYPSHLAGKTSSFMPVTINRCYDMPNHLMKLCFRLIKDNEKYKKDPLKVGRMLYDAFFRNNIGELIKFMIEYPEIQPILSKLQD